MKPTYDHFRPVIAEHDKKAKAHERKDRELKTEATLRLEEANKYLNTEDHGYIQLDEENDRERTLKVKQEDLKSMLGV
jgi:hypothetical protein